MHQYLSLREKIGFSIGEYSASVVWGSLMFFLPVFYTDTFGLSAATVGTMFLIVRLFDSVNDPVMGTIADHTHTRWGKFRPYLLWFAIPYGLAAILMFSVPDLHYQGKIIYAYVTYTLMMIIYTAIMIPYNSMVGVMSPNPDERTSLSSLKFVFAYAASMSVQGLVIPMVEWLGKGDDILGYRYTMTLFGVVCIVFFIIAFLSSKERVYPDPAQKTDIKQDYKNLFQNKAWVVLILVSLGILIYVAIRSAVIMYYFQYYLNYKEGAGIFMVVGTICVLLGVFPTKYLSRQMGKRNLFITCMVLISISSALFFWAGKNMFWLYVFQIIFSLASGPTMPLLWSMLADAADYGEWKYGRRSTGLVYSAATFAQKAGFSIGGALTMWMLSGFGYVANAVQSEDTLLGIKLSMSILPAVIAALTIVALLYYNLDQKNVEKIAISLEEKRNLYR